MAHSEDYSEPFGDHIGRWSLCYWCHLLLHCRRRAPEAYLRYVLMLQGGERFVNGDGIQWAAVQRYLRVQGEPARESTPPVADPFGPLLREGAAAQARQIALVSRHPSEGLHAKRAIGYRRVSTDEQELGLDAQQSAIEACCARQTFVLAATYTDQGLSGGLPIEKRPGLLAAVNALRRGDVLIVAKRDRLGRDVLHVAMTERLVERRGARIVSAAGEGTDTEGPTGQLMRGVIDLFAQFERAIIGLRTSAALQAKKARGERAGTLPFGMRLSDDGRTLDENPNEQAALTFIRAKRASGWTLQAIADELNALGHRTRPGGFWRQQYVRRLLRR
jgi:DNA invertase Pin-like site-specific DNA recombinase